MAGRKLLLALDDATGSDQVRSLLPGTAGTLVLVTSRRRLTALPEALPVTLDILEADQAAQLFVRLAERAGLLPGDEAVANVVSLCGYLPLAISMMAGQLKHHAAWTAADLAAELKSAADRPSIMSAENDPVAASTHTCLPPAPRPATGPGAPQRRLPLSASRQHVPRAWRRGMTRWPGWTPSASTCTPQPATPPPTPWPAMPSPSQPRCTDSC